MPQPHKGLRDHFSVKPTIDVGIEARKEAASRGLSISDFVSLVLAERYGLPATNPTPIRSPQQELPMTG